VKTEEITRSEIVAIIGGVLLAVGLFLAWYHLENKNVTLNGTPGPKTFSGWQAHPILRWLLLAAAAAPLILAWIIARGHALSWPRGEMTAVVSVAAFGLIAYNAFVSKPGTVSSLVSLRLGIFVSLIGSLLMLGGSALRASATERPRKPPGTL
jgi:cation transport ATPase